MTEMEKMLAGELYDPNDLTLLSLRRKCHKLCKEYNLLDEDDEKRQKILLDIGIKIGENAYFQGPIYFDYGCFITVGKNFYCNFNFTVLDVCPVNIGDNVFIGTGVSILPPVHPLKYKDRNQYINSDGNMTDREYGKPITIKDNCWIASNVTICGGVTIGEGSVIGAGSVVTRDIPDNSFAAGNPCQVIKKIEND